MEYSLIANSGIHITTLDIEINTREKFSLWFHEWYDTTDGVWVLDLAQEVNTETNQYFYKKKDLFENGYLKNATGNGDIDVSDLNDDGIKPLRIDEEMCAGVDGEIFKMNFTDRNNTLSAFENKWLPIPYFLKRGETRFNFGPLNWSRFKLVPVKSQDEGVKTYKVLLAFDTRSSNTNSEYNECPVFSDFNNEKRFEVCKNEYLLMDFCSPKQKTEYINKYLFMLHIYPQP